MLEHAGRPYSMKTRQKAPDPLQYLTVVEFWPAATAPRTDTERKTAKVVQARARQLHRPHRRYFGVFKFA